MGISEKECDLITRISTNRYKVLLGLFKSPIRCCIAGFLYPRNLRHRNRKRKPCPENEILIREIHLFLRSGSYLFNLRAIRNKTTMFRYQIIAGGYESMSNAVNSNLKQHKQLSYCYYPIVNCLFTLPILIHLKIMLVIK